MKQTVKRLVFQPYFNLLKTLRHAGVLKTPTIKICISTIEKYAAKTIPDLLTSLYAAGIKKEDIYVVEGGHQQNRKIEHAVNYYHADHNSFDLTALISVVDLNIETDYWFLLHDTCVVGTNFQNLISNVPHSLPEVLVLRNFPSMNMGLYKKDYLLRKKDVLFSMRNRDYSNEGVLAAKKKAIDEEDILFKQKDIDGKVWVINPWLMKIDGNYRISSTDAHNYYSDRIVEYFPQVDLYKFKANFNMSRTNIIDL